MKEPELEDKSLDQQFKELLESFKKETAQFSETMKQIIKNEERMSELLFKKK